MTSFDRSVLLHAAKLLYDNAWALRMTHTVAGKWTADEKEARAEYLDEVRTVRALRRMARRA